MIRCRACENERLEVFLSLGKTPLANALPRPEELALLQGPEPTFPLDVAFCPDCTLVQIVHTVPPQQLFSEYLYFSSFSATMLEHARTVVEKLVRERKLDGNSLALEIASNDGYLLQWYLKANVGVLGVEPARNIAKVAVEKGVPTRCDFFDGKLADALVSEGRRADVIHANNVLAHVDDLNGVVGGISRLLKPSGVAVIEVPYVRDLVEHVEFDTIYHEHLCYFSLTALERLFRRHDLIIEDVERLSIHGGSLRLYAVPKAAAKVTANVAALLAEEADSVARAEFYRGFSRRVEALKVSLNQLLAELKSSGKHIAAYGAAAKGSTLLNTFGIGQETLDFVADRSLYKQGRLMPGVHVPIVAPAALLERMPDYVLLLTWNFAQEILEQQSEYRGRGGKFIIPIPSPTVV